MPQITQLSEVFGSQLFWLALVFGFIFLVVGRSMLPKVRSTMVDRDRRVADDLERANAARAIADSTEQAWRERLDQARLEAARIAQDARQSNAIELEGKIKAALGEIDARTEQARQRIRDRVEGARAEMESFAAEAAQQMVEKLTGLKVDRDVAAKAVAREFEQLAGGGDGRVRTADEKKSRQAA